MSHLQSYNNAWLLGDVNDNVEQIFRILCSRTWTTVNYRGKILYSLNRYVFSTLWNHRKLELAGVLETIWENPLIFRDDENEFLSRILFSDRAMNYNSDFLIPFFFFKSLKGTGKYVESDMLATFIEVRSKLDWHPWTWSLLHVFSVKVKDWNWSIDRSHG